MEKAPIASLGEEQDVLGFYMVRSKQLRALRDRTGQFLVLRLGDKSGEIDAKVWENAAEWHAKLKSGTVLKIGGHTQTYNGRLEMNVSRLRPARDDEYVLDDFLPASDRDRTEMLRELDEAVSSVSNPHLAALLNRLFNGGVREPFARAPAAKLIHHACLGGLLEHTLEVVRLCKAALDLHPRVDRDLLLTGALLHDVGKIKEYAYAESIDFTDEGQLLGHVALGEELLVANAREITDFPPELLLRLRHMLISHHGQYEWQSPKRPKTIEACILHLADYFSSQVAIFNAAIGARNDRDAGWTDYNRVLNRAVFVGSTPLPPAQPDDLDTVRRVLEERYEAY